MNHKQAYEIVLGDLIALKKKAISKKDSQFISTLENLIANLSAIYDIGNL